MKLFFPPILYLVGTVLKKGEKKNLFFIICVQYNHISLGSGSVFLRRISTRIRNTAYRWNEDDRKSVLRYGSCKKCKENIKRTIRLLFELMYSSGVYFLFMCAKYKESQVQLMKIISKAQEIKKILQKSY